MSRRLNRIWLLPALLLVSESWALGLGDIRLSSSLNEPLRAQIELLSTTPEDVASLDIQVASAETFDRYGLDRPAYLSSLQFDVVQSGQANEYVVTVTSIQPVTEPFITFLAEAIWSRGRLLREYTLLLDPPTFAPPPVAQSSEAVTAPSRASQTDSGRIERPAPQQQPAAPPPAAPPQRVPGQAALSRPDTSPATQSEQFDTTQGGEYRVQRGDTLWGIARSVSTDGRVSLNQTMLAIFEANPDAFAGNINVMSAGAYLRIPSADDIIRINRGEALSEVQRQHAAWSGASQTQPSLVLVPPDDQQAAYDGGVTSATDTSGDAAAQERIRELEQMIADQDSLLEIRDDELAQLRAELARLRGEDLEPLPADTAVDDELAVDDTIPDDAQLLGDDEVADTGVDEEPAIDDTAADTAADEEPVTTTQPPPRVVSTGPQEPGLVDTVVGFLSGFWGILIGGLIIVLGLLIWFVQRAGRDGDEDSTGVWEALDADDLDQESLVSTERLRAMAREEDAAIVVVEQGAIGDGGDEGMSSVLEAPPEPTPDSGADPLADTGVNKSLEDTFSSETAINLDQSDPVAEADFHMAYGLYDQAADLINGALAVDPDRQDLLAKLCEIYFVWGNRDAFIDAAGRMRATVGDDDANADWDKIVIMGQQIAGEHELFSGVSAGAATRAVDLSFEGGMEETGALDMDLAAEGDGAASDVIDLGAGSGEIPGLGEESEDIDFLFGQTDAEIDADASVTVQMPETPADEGTVESPTMDAALGDETVEREVTVETPTIEQQFETLEATGELPTFGDADATEVATLDDDEPDATAEIELDDLGLDLDGLAETGFAADLEGDELLSDLDDTTESQTLKIDPDLEATGRNPALDADLDATGRNLAVDESDDDLAATTGTHEGFDIADALEATNEVPAADDMTGSNPLFEPEAEDTDVGLDTSLLDATGMTQILSDDLAVETAGDVGGVLGDQEETLLAPADDDDTRELPAEAETLLAPLDDEDSTLLSEDGDFDFAKTEALPKDAFMADSTLDDTGELPGIAGSTDMDLDLDDLTAALKVSEMGDTVNQPLEDATVEQPRMRPGQDVDLDVGDVDEEDHEPTRKIAPDELSGDLHDARTMTEVGTKLDLARAYVDMGDPGGARSILEEVLDEGDESQRQQAQQLLDSLPG